MESLLHQHGRNKDNVNVDVWYACGIQETGMNLKKKKEKAIHKFNLLHKKQGVLQINILLYYLYVTSFRNAFPAVFYSSLKTSPSPATQCLSHCSITKYLLFPARAMSLSTWGLCFQLASSLLSLPQIGITPVVSVLAPWKLLH